MNLIWEKANIRKTIEKKKLGVLGLSLISINNIMGLKNIPFAATVGPSAILFWVIAALLYFIPISLIVAELSTTYPEQGGIIAWVNRAFGKKASFLCGWFYWVANFTYYPSLMIGIMVNIAYAATHQEIIENTWLTTIVNISGHSCVLYTLCLFNMCLYQASENRQTSVRPFNVKRDITAYFVAGIGLLSVIGTIVLTLIPSPDTTVAQYAPLVIGPVVSAVLGFWFYRLGSKEEEKDIALKKIS